MIIVYFGESFGGIITGARGAVLLVLLRTDASLTGRQIHEMVRDEHSLWAVQEAVKALTGIGLVESRTVGRAGLHTLNEGHAAVAPLRALSDPIAMLRVAVDEAIDARVQTVLLFGSIARGEAAPDSDLDLAVIAAPGWDGRLEVVDSVRKRLGNACDVLVFTPRQFLKLARAGEPVVSDILHDGVALVGVKPRIKRRVA